MDNTQTTLNKIRQKLPDKNPDKAQRNKESFIKCVVCLTANFNASVCWADFKYGTEYYPNLVKYERCKM